MASDGPSRWLIDGPPSGLVTNDKQLLTNTQSSNMQYLSTAQPLSHSTQPRTPYSEGCIPGLFFLAFE